MTFPGRRRWLLFLSNCVFLSQQKKVTDVQSTTSGMQLSECLVWPQRYLLTYLTWTPFLLGCSKNSLPFAIRIGNIRNMRFWGTPCFQTNRRRHPMSKLFFLPEDMLHDFPQWLDLPLNFRRKEVAIHLQTMQWWRCHRGDQRLVNPKWALRITV